MPTATDLVTDLPADFEVFGQAVASSMADLLGGTTGQILSKASNTDMDFTWIANDQGDITGVTASSPLTGGGTSGAITVGIQDALTTQKGAVQLSDSTSTTSSILAATPTAVKSAYDLAAAAVPKSTVTTAGDVIYATGSGAVTRLGIGTANQVLRVNSGATAPEWATPSTGAMTLITSQALSATATLNVNDCFSTTYRNYLIIMEVTGTAAEAISCRLRVSGSDATTNYNQQLLEAKSTTISGSRTTAAALWSLQATRTSGRTFFVMNINSPFEASSTSFVSPGIDPDSTISMANLVGVNTNATSYTGISFYQSTSTMTGNVSIYGLAK